MSRNVSTGRIPAFTLGERIRKTREDLGMSQQQFAVAIGHDRKTLGNWENGRYKIPPNYGDLMIIASVGDVSLEWLAGELYRPTTGAAHAAGNPSASAEDTQHSLTTRRYQFSHNVVIDPRPVTQAA